MNNIVSLVPETIRNEGVFTPVSVSKFTSMGKDGPSKTSIPNVKQVFDAARIKPKWDLFSQRAYLEHDGELIALGNSTLLEALGMMHYSGLEISLSFLNTAIEVLSQKNIFDSAIDFFESLPVWDGVVRAETLFIDELGADDTPYVRGATRLFFATLVRRGMGKESKADGAVILIGEQDLGKSTLFNYLIGKDLFQENVKLSHSTREVLELTLGKLVVELAELSGMKKTDRDDVKTFLSKSSDEFSLKFEKRTTKQSRRFTFIGTANNEGKLVNMLEGDRRFIMVPVKNRADLNRVKRDRLQILAEAVHIEKNYGPILELDRSLWNDAVAERSKVIAKDGYDSALEQAFGGIVSAKITAADVYAFLGLKDRVAIGKYTAATGGINPIMEKLGWEYKLARKGKTHARAFVKGSDGGWLRAAWPRGAQSVAEIDVDESINPRWTPEYTD